MLHTRLRSIVSGSSYDIIYAITKVWNPWPSNTRLLRYMNIIKWVCYFSQGCATESMQECDTLPLSLLYALGMANSAPSILHLPTDQVMSIVNSVDTRVSCADNLNIKDHSNKSYIIANPLIHNTNSIYTQSFWNFQHNIRSVNWCTIICTSL